MNTRLSDLEQLVTEIKKFRPDCVVAATVSIFSIVMYIIKNDILQIW